MRLRPTAFLGFALAALLHASAPSTAHASGGDLVLLDDEQGAGFLVGLAAFPTVLLTYAVVGVDYDGLLVPPPLAWTQLGVSTAAYVAALAYEDATFSTMAIATAAPLLALHAFLSIVDYEPDPKEEEGFVALVPGGGRSVQFVWCRRF